MEEKGGKEMTLEEKEKLINEEAIRQGDIAEDSLLRNHFYKMTHNEKQLFMKGFGMGMTWMFDHADEIYKKITQKRR
jgi:hypothetical protein